MLEGRWDAVPPQTLTVDGGLQGQITVADTDGFRVKQSAYLKNNTTTLAVQVKRVLSSTQLVVGKIDGKIDSWLPLDISAFTTASGAVIGAEQQNKNNIPTDDHYRAVYESDPVVADRAVLVDKYGRKIDNVVDNHGINRLAVDGQFHAEVDVQVDVDIDGVYDPVTNPDPDNVGLVAFERSNPTDDTKQTQRVTALRGSAPADTSTVSQDVSLHDQNGNSYTPLNPVPVSTTYERFFALINGSNWLKLGDYDEVVPSFTGNDLTLSYREGGAVIGEALITNYVSQTGWTLTLTTFINDDDGSKLLDDDSTPLNLD